MVKTLIIPALLLINCMTFGNFFSRPRLLIYNMNIYLVVRKGESVSNGLGHSLMHEKKNQ